MNIEFIRRSQFLQLAALRRELKKKSRHLDQGSANLSELSIKDQKFIHQIKERTCQYNLNNVTRTMAYYDFYRRHPEIHWAFLGHMVSINGGWNMTDLKGELLSKLLTEEEQKELFLFLERGNWLIFQDVFPQFLLYEESLKTNELVLSPEVFPCIHFYGNNVAPFLEIWKSLSFSCGFNHQRTKLPREKSGSEFLLSKDRVSNH